VSGSEWQRVTVTDGESGNGGSGSGSGEGGVSRVGTKINFRENFAKIRTQIIFVFRENCLRKCENFAFRENEFLTKIRKFRFSRK
jgi:hypothetical protein